MKNPTIFQPIIFLFIALFIGICARSIFAQTFAYKITDPFTAPPPTYPFRGEVFYWKSFNVNYTSGQMILSLNPDGTGNMNIGDGFQVQITNQTKSGATQTYTYTTPDCKVHQVSPLDLTQYFKSPPAQYNVFIRLMDWCGGSKDISSLYLVNINAPDPTATITPIPSFTPTPSFTPSLTPSVLPPTPTLTSTPTSTPLPSPLPFLDLPWDYQSKGLSFNDAALSMTSFFDHEYPFLSTSLTEPSLAQDTIVEFNGKKSSSDFYSSHDGYDYARAAKVYIGDQVLAAGAGTATYVNTCGPCGNMIVIDHGNGYQSRYMHLQKDGLITSTTGQKVQVTARQQIGKVGATGNVSPSGDAGAHLHFMVVEDKDHDGNFDNNIPDGLMDPFGWSGPQSDPWIGYAFSYAGKNRTGSNSYYLWQKKLDEAVTIISPGGTTYKLGKFTFSFPPGESDKDIQFILQSSPLAALTGHFTESLGQTITAIAKDPVGSSITQFPKLYTIMVDFSSFDLSRYNLNTLSIYSSKDGLSWAKENTVIDSINKKAITQIDHLTQFALMADRFDTTPPVTTISLQGDTEDSQDFKSKVGVQLVALDNGIGTDYTLYKLDSEDWDQYKTEVEVLNEGKHTIQTYSVDKDDNIEKVSTAEFLIDKTPPLLKIEYKES